MKGESSVRYKMFLTAVISVIWNNSVINSQLAWKPEGSTNVKHRALSSDITKILETVYDIKIHETVQLWILL
jgi:hypothetical protein